MARGRLTSRTLASIATLAVIMFISGAGMKSLGQTAARPDRGIMPTGAYTVSDNRP
jgi:hypothetical protein